MLEFDITNTQMDENDMSKSEKYEYDVLLHIIRKGEPIAAYEIKEALKMNQPTVWNICRSAEKEGDLTQEDGSRNKIMYGPTWQGLIRLCAMNEKMLKEIDTMLDGWFDQQKFKESVREDFGEVVTKNPDYAKTLTKKIIKYDSRVKAQIKNITDEEYDGMEYLIAEKKLLLKYPVEVTNSVEFYTHVKFYRESIDQMFAANLSDVQFLKAVTKA